MNGILTTETATSGAEGQRRARILEGATPVFLAYGFQRTTMDDIARAAGISRPALYLVFRNKGDIYRALVTEFLEKTLENSRAVLAGEGPLAERLEKSLFCTLDMMNEIEASPHGAEILDMKNSLAADLVVEGRKRYQKMVEAAIAQAGAVDDALADAGITPAGLANMMLDAFDGMKARGLPASAQREAARVYIAVVAGAARG